MAEKAKGSTSASYRTSALALMLRDICDAIADAIF